MSLLILFEQPHKHTFIGPCISSSHHCWKQKRGFTDKSSSHGTTHPKATDITDLAWQRDLSSTKRLFVMCWLQKNTDAYKRQDVGKLEAVNKTHGWLMEMTDALSGGRLLTAAHLKNPCWPWNVFNDSNWIWEKWTANVFFCFFFNKLLSSEICLNLILLQIHCASNPMIVIIILNTI